MTATSALPVWISTRPIAHRGLHNLAAGIPENSLAAFAAAIAANHPIELDVRLSRDGAPIVFHDATLERSSKRPDKISSLTADELAKVTIFGTSETIPTLQDVFALVAGRVPILIEVKNYADSAVGPLEAAVRDAINGYKGETAVQSFGPETVAWFAREMPQQPRGQLSSPDIGKRLGLIKRLALELQLRTLHGAPHFIGYNVKNMPSPLTQKAHARGLPVLAWTVRSAADRQRAAQYADNIIFEHE